MPDIPINVRRVLVVIGIFILVFVVLEFNRRLEELNLLDDQHRLMSGQATQAIQTQQYLQTQVGFAGSTAAVEEWARTDGHYIKNGDFPFVPVAEPGTAPLELTTPIPPPTPMQKWEVWRDLFFGE